MSRLLCLVAVGATAAALLVATSAAEPQAARIVNRTFSCEAGFVGALHQVTLYSRYATSPGSTRLRASSSVTQNMFESLGSLRSDGLSVHRGHCLPARSPVKLTTRSLRGGAVPPLGAELTCDTPRRLLLRVRAVFERPVTPQTSRQYGFPQLTASGALEQAAFALATPSGRQIAYLSVTGTEKARLFTVRTCRED